MQKSDLAKIESLYLESLPTGFGKRATKDRSSFVRDEKSAGFRTARELRSTKTEKRIEAERVWFGRPLQAVEVIEATAEHCGVPVPMVLSDNRSYHVVAARKIAMYLCHEVLRMNYDMIGRAFLKDPTTVLRNVRSVHIWRQSNKSVDQAINRLKALLK